MHPAGSSFPNCRNGLGHSIPSTDQRPPRFRSLPGAVQCRANFSSPRKLKFALQARSLIAPSPDRVQRARGFLGTGNGPTRSARSQYAPPTPAGHPVGVGGDETTSIKTVALQKPLLYLRRSWLNVEFPVCTEQRAGRDPSLQPTAAARLNAGQGGRAWKPSPTKTLAVSPSGALCVAFSRTLRFNV